MNTIFTCQFPHCEGHPVQPTTPDKLAAFDKPLTADKPLDDIDVRQADETGEDGSPERPIEFATFCEGEYCESIYVTLERARDLHRQLGDLLQVIGGAP